MFGQLQLSGGKDISGRKIGTEFHLVKQVNINEYSNVNQITSFGAAQPILLHLTTLKFFSVRRD
jgi:hypothetical protein